MFVWISPAVRWCSGFCVCVQWQWARPAGWRPASSSTVTSHSGARRSARTSWRSWWRTASQQLRRRSWSPWPSRHFLPDGEQLSDPPFSRTWSEPLLTACCKRTNSKQHKMLQLRHVFQRCYTSRCRRSERVSRETTDGVEKRFITKKDVPQTRQYTLTQLTGKHTWTNKNVLKCSLNN